MGKKKSKKKLDDGLSKKERKALKEREAALAAEIERRTSDATKKVKPGKKKRAERATVAETMAVDTGALGEMTIGPEDGASVVIDASDVAERATPLAGDELQAALDADTEAGKERRAFEDAKIKARVKARRVERQERQRALQDGVAADRAERIADQGDQPETAESETATETVEPTPKAPVLEEFAKPSEAPPQLEEGRNGYKIIQLDENGKPDPRKVRQMTRVTTFVGNIDDESALTDWLHRLLAVGISSDAAEFVPLVNDLVHRRDVKIAKAQKADRKGKLGIGEVAQITRDAEKEFKDAMKALVEDALDRAGRHDKADAGTNLHTLAEVADEKGVDDVRAMHEAEEISATDLASIEAYAERMARLNAKVIESEAVVVNDAMGYAGRLDRIIMAKLPELTINGVTRPADQRARRYVADIKSGRVDLGAGKIARQLAAYALGDLYDLETGERRRHSAARDVALVFHLPQGEGVCRVHPVDIKEGARLLKLSAEVRRARNTGRKTIDTSVDIADPEPATPGETNESEMSNE
tara:strand:+ start:5319 stop:6908 length:1590 start_codon:yes stop_codon:yes gene_type:complete